MKSFLSQKLPLKFEQKIATILDYNMQTYSEMFSLVNICHIYLSCKRPVKWFLHAKWIFYDIFFILSLVL